MTKTTDEHGNGTSGVAPNAFTTHVIDENPYLQQRRDEIEPSKDQNEFDEVIDDEDGAPIETEERSTRLKHLRRRLALAGIAGLLFFAIAVAVVLYKRMPTRVDYGRSRQGEVLPNAPTSTTAVGRDSRTEKAIEEAQRLTEQEHKESAGNITDASTTDRVSESKPMLETPFTFPTSSSGEAAGTMSPDSKVSDSADERPSNGSAASGASTSTPTRLQSQRSSETSLYITESAAVHAVNPTPKKAVESKPENTALKTSTITLPAFGSMLPVRTIGALYTLRTGALVRFELIRDVTSDGWSMKRGTVLVGTNKGSDYDRAYVSLVGFIEPQTGKLVKLRGDLLGGDGAAGLKGRRRPIDGGWTRAFSRLASSAVDITGALLSGRSRDTVIISDGVRTRTINPVTEEISGVLGIELNRNQTRSFVEVTAGTPGYVLVTDLPSVIEGTEPTPELNNDTLASITDVNATREVTGLSERELADLLANGTPEQIKAAMPRMSPEMRKVAESVLRP